MGPTPTREGMTKEAEHNTRVNVRREHNKRSTSVRMYLIDRATNTELSPFNSSVTPRTPPVVPLVVHNPADTTSAYAELVAQLSMVSLPHADRPRP